MRDAGVVADLEPDTFAALAGHGAVFRIEPVRPDCQRCAREEQTRHHLIPLPE